MHAVFVVAERGGWFAATTRCADTGEDPKTVAFPGGKIDPGETIREAAIREAHEEGWEFRVVESDPFFVAEVEGKMVAWVRAFGPKKLLHFKEQNRLRNVMATAEKLSSQNPAFRNAEALKYHD